MPESTTSVIGGPRAPPPGRIRRAVGNLFGVLYRWAESGWSRSAVGTWALLQSSVVPGPSDALLVPLGLADPKKSFDLAFWATLGSVLGALAAYAIGALAFDQLGAPLLSFLGVGDRALERIGALFEEKGWLVVVLGSLPLLSTKATCIAAGAFGVPLGEFTLAVSAVRAARFFLTALLLRLAGTQIARWIEGKVRRREKGEQTGDKGRDRAEAAGGPP
jgi:membrane protein YqaA with SNARE-associated domain